MSKEKSPQSSSRKKASPQKDAPVIQAFKAFNSDFKCRGFQFEVGQTYKSDQDPVRCGSNGFHACDNPFDVWSYYPLVADDGSLTRYAIVEAAGKIDRADADDTKFAAAEITIKHELRFPEFLNSAISWAINNFKDDGEISSGYGSQQASSGDYSQQASSGDYSRHTTEGQNSVITSSGNGTRAQGCNGTWISLAEFDHDGRCVGFATGCIGTQGLKENTWYIAKNGQLAEIEP